MTKRSIQIGGGRGPIALDADDINYEPETPGDWPSPPPEDVGQALDQLAAKSGDSAFISIKEFGAAGNGTHDDAPEFLTAETYVAPRGITLWLPGGNTFLLRTKWVTPNNTQMRGSPTAVVNQQYTAGAGAAWSNSFIYQTAAQTTLGSLHSTPSLGDVSLDIDVPAAPVVGQPIFVENGPGLLTAATYRITSVTHVSGTHYTVGISRPVVFPFVATGSGVALCASAPSNILNDGQQMTVSGTGDAVWELFAAMGCEIRGLNYDERFGDVTGLGGSVGNLDAGGYSNLASDSKAVVGGATESGWQMQSQERSVFRRLECSWLGTGPSFNGIAIYDSYNSTAEDCWVYGTTSVNAAAIGFNLGTFGPGNCGNISCSIRGGGVIDMGVGVFVGQSVDTGISDFVAQKCNIGIEVFTGASGTVIRNANVSYNNDGLYLSGSTDTEVYGLDISHCTGYGLYAGAPVRAYGVKGDFASTDTAFCIHQPAAGTAMLLSGARLNSAVVSGIGVNVSGSGCTIEDSTFTMTGGGASCAVTVNAGDVYLSGVKSVSSVYGVIGYGGTVHIGPGCDFSGGANALFFGGSAFVMEQTGGVAAIPGTASPVALTFLQHYNMSIELAAGATGDTTVTTYPIPGLTFVARNLSAHNLVVKTSSVATVTVAAGKSAEIQVDEAGDMVRVTVDQ